MDKIAEVSESGRSSAQNRPATPEVALIGSFNRLVLSGRYDEISVKTIAGQADVSRSTFYEYFAGKEDLFRASFAPIAKSLVAGTLSANGSEGAERVLEHFREHRDRVIEFFAGNGSDLLTTTLAEGFRDKLTAKHPRTELNLDLIASQLSEIVTGLIRAWLKASCPVPSDQIAKQIHLVTRSIVEELPCADPDGLF